MSLARMAASRCGATCAFSWSCGCIAVSKRRNIRLFSLVCLLLLLLLVLLLGHVGRSCSAVRESGVEVKSEAWLASVALGVAFAPWALLLLGLKLLSR